MPWDKSKHDFIFYGNNMHTVSFFRYANVTQLYNAACSDLTDFNSSYVDILGYAKKTQNADVSSMVVRNTWDDWGLVSASKQIIAPPSVKTQYQDLTGTDFTYDLTDWPDSMPHYGPREGSMNFLVDPEIIRQRGQNDLMNDIYAFMHGQRLLCVLEDDPGYIYSGRFSVGEFKDGSPCAGLTIEYHMEPLKVNLVHLGDAPLWNPYNISTGIVRDQSYAENQVDYFRDTSTGKSIRMCVLKDYARKYAYSYTVNGFIYRGPENKSAAKSIRIKLTENSRRTYIRLAAVLPKFTAVKITIRREIPNRMNGSAISSEIVLRNDTGSQRFVAAFYDPRAYIGGSVGEIDTIKINASATNNEEGGTSIVKVGIDYREGLI